MKAERTTATRRGGQKKEHQAIVQSALAEAQREETAPEATPPSPVCWEERRQMIATAAYFRAERRGFQGGDPAQDWFAAAP
jgi:hypothetical protein